MNFVTILFCLVIGRYRAQDFFSYRSCVLYFKSAIPCFNFGKFCDLRILVRREKIVETLAVFLTPNAEGQIWQVLMSPLLKCSLLKIEKFGCPIGQPNFTIFIFLVARHEILVAPGKRATASVEPCLWSKHITPCSHNLLQMPKF